MTQDALKPQAPEAQEKAKSIAPKPKDMFDVTITIMQDLSSLLTEELARLESHDLKGVQDLLPMKNRLVLDYNANLKAMTADPAVFDTMDPDKREKMRVIGKKLEEIADANATALKAAVDGTEVILHNIMMQVRDDSRTFHTYHDTRGGHASTKEADCKPVAINRTA